MAGYHAEMRPRDAMEMLAGSDVARLGPTTWADLGCGEGTFTLALAGLLAPGSRVHAMDRDAAALRAIPAERDGVRIDVHQGDFTQLPWPFADLDGILMANSLHYVRGQSAFLRRCAAQLQPANTPHRFLVVEYDTDAANRWVPYPVSQTTLPTLFEAAGYRAVSIRLLGSRPSIYQRVPLYAALIEAEAAAG